MFKFLLLSAVSAKQISFDLSKRGGHQDLIISEMDTNLVAVEDADVTKNLRDYRDVQIFTQVLMGSNDQPFDMIFDTGSNWLWVSSNLCDNCPNKPGFNHKASNSFHVTDDSAKMLNYGSGSVIGY